MRWITQALFFGAIIALCAMMPVHASRIPETPAGGTEPGVHEIYNSRYGTAYASPAELDVMRVHDMDFFAVPEGHYVYAQGIGHYANDSGGFGWYWPILPDGGLAHAILFTVTGPQAGDLTINGEYTATFTPPDKFGLYLRRPDGTRYYSEPHRNPNNADQLVVYATPTDENTYLICWEDRDGPSSDYDYNDLVLEITFVPTP